jgi:Mg2+-importing ATPase
MSINQTKEKPATSHSPRETGRQISQDLIDYSRLENEGVLSRLATSIKGLSPTEVEERTERYGPNEVAKEKKRNWLGHLWDNIRNPLVILLVVLGIISYLTSDIRTTVMILIMVILGIILRFVQESRADNAAEKLKASLYLEISSPCLQEI